MQFPTLTPLSTVFPQANSVTFRPTSSKHHKVYEKHCGTKQVYVDLNCTNLPLRPLPPCHRPRRRHSLPLPPPRPVPRIIHICHLPAQPRTVHESPTEPITGLGFREPTEDIMNTRLFVVTTNRVLWYQASGGRERGSVRVVEHTLEPTCHHMDTFLSQCYNSLCDYAELCC